MFDKPAEVLALRLRRRAAHCRMFHYANFELHELLSGDLSTSVAFFYDFERSLV